MGVGEYENVTVFDTKYVSIICLASLNILYFFYNDKTNKQHVLGDIYCFKSYIHAIKHFTKEYDIVDKTPTTIRHTLDNI